MKEANLKDFIPVLYVTIVVCVSVSMLTLVDSVTRDLIDTQIEEEKLEMLKELFPKMTDFDDDTYSDIDVIIILNGTERIGYAFEVEGKGYGGKIDIMVGIELNLEEPMLRGITIREPTLETPGLGARITTESWFQEQFQGVAVDDVKLTKDGGKIDAISGATVSSTAVLEAVHEIANEKVALLKEKEGG